MSLADTPLGIWAWALLFGDVLDSELDELALDAPPAEASERRARIAVVAAGLAWLGAVGIGFGALLQFANQPGEGAGAPRAWPADSELERVGGRPTLLVFAHPQCACTRATLAELERIVGRVAGATVHVLVLRESGASSHLESAIFQRAARIPGVRTAWDIDGVEAARFGARTSGQALVYDADGRLVFHGGMTGSRGHEGDNLGRRRIIAALTSGRPDHEGSSVFGCELGVAPEEAQ